MVKHCVYNSEHIRPLEVRPLTDPESVQKPWGILIFGPQRCRSQS
jgi:hypothetical protein